MNATKHFHCPTDVTKAVTNSARLTRKFVRSEKIAASSASSDSALAQQILPRSMSDVGGAPERFLELSISSIVTHSRSGLRGNTIESDPDKRFLSEKVKKGDNTSVSESFF